MGLDHIGRMHIGVARADYWECNYESIDVVWRFEHSELDNANMFLYPWFSFHFVSLSCSLLFQSLSFKPLSATARL